MPSVILTSLVEYGMIEIAMQGVKYKVYLKLGLASKLYSSVYQDVETDFSKADIVISGLSGYFPVCPGISRYFPPCPIPTPPPENTGKYFLLQLFYHFSYKS